MIEGQNNGDSAQALTVDSAAKALEGLLSAEAEEQQPEKATDDKTPEAQSSPEDEQGKKPAESEEQSDTDEEDAAPSDEDDEDAPEDEPEQPVTHRLKVAGEEVEVTLDELKKGYSREKDYTQKSQKLAEDRRKIEAELTPEKEAVRADRQRLATQITEFENAIKALSQEPDWDTLRRENPDLFAETWAAWDQHQKRIERISAERAQAVAAVQKDLEAQHATHMAGERTKLIEAIPTWSDAEVAKKESDDLIAYGKQLGFSPDELRGVSDHRALVTLRKAMLFDRAEQARADAKKTAQSKIDKVKAAPPGPSARSKPKVTDATRARQRHAKVGSVDSAAEALTLMLDD